MAIHVLPYCEGIYSSILCRQEKYFVPMHNDQSEVGEVNEIVQH